MVSRKHALRYIVLTAVLLVAALSGVFAFRNAGLWLIHEDSLSRGDVILVLSGGMPYRAEEAANVYRAGYAPEVWLTHPVSPAADLRVMGIEYEPEEHYDAEVLQERGVPAADIRVLPNEIVDTEQELQEAGDEMKREGKSTIIIVTSMQHTRRTSVLWRDLIGSYPRAIVHGAPEDPFDAGHWWRNTRDSLALVREYLGLLNAWTGLHVRPRQIGRAR
jgi:uncharacterized SAM-binding protein YcdF (DUF218 family)